MELDLYAAFMGFCLKSYRWDAFLPYVSRHVLFVLSGLTEDGHPPGEALFEPPLGLSVGVGSAGAPWPVR